MSWEANRRREPRLLAAGLAGTLQHGCAVRPRPVRLEHYRGYICAGLKYLLRLQSTKDGTAREHGGFGVSFSERAQRIDIKGHAASAFMKSIENAIECGE